MNNTFANYGNFLRYISIDNNTILNFINYGFSEKYPKDKLIKLQMVVDNFIMNPDEFVDGINKLLDKKYTVDNIFQNIEQIYMLMREIGQYPTIDDIVQFNLLFSNMYVN